MGRLTTPDGTELYVNDWGSGRPVVLIHGWPLNADMWSDHAIHLVNAGHRVVTYDRRGFGRSSQPWNGYDYDTLADDLAVVIDTLDLKEVALVGFSMGGGEVARYLGRHGAGRVRRAVLVSAVTPYMMKTLENPEGVDRMVLDEMLENLAEDRPGFLTTFFGRVYGNGILEKRVSAAVVQWSVQMAMQGSLRATLESVKTFGMTDLRGDMAAFTMPTLLVHGTADATVPIDVSSRRAAALMPHARLVEYEGEPHGLPATAKDRLTEDLIAFLLD